MFYELFAVYDSKAEAYLPPFILPKVAQAERVFADCVRSDSHQFSANPADYTLFHLGQFDDAKGQHLLKRAPVSLGNGLEFGEGRQQYQSPELGNGKAWTQSQRDEASVLSGSTGEDSS